VATSRPSVTDAVPRIVGDVLASASGAERRDDPVLPRTGGPAGNARLTAWTGLILLAGYVAECFTLLSLHAMLNVHILIGAILVPLVLLKTATTAWRIVRYYLKSASYRIAGPPPLLLRILGPLVVLTGLAVLGSGLALLPLGQSSFTPIFTVGGQSIDPLTVHKLCFVLWLAITGAHVLARTVPALQLTTGHIHGGAAVPGRTARTLIVVATLAVGVATGVVVMNLSSNWTSGQVHRDDNVGEHSLGDPNASSSGCPGVGDRGPSALACADRSADDESAPRLETTHDDQWIRRSSLAEIN